MEREEYLKVGCCNCALSFCSEGLYYCYEGRNMKGYCPTKDTIEKEDFPKYFNQFKNDENSNDNLLDTE